MSPDSNLLFFGNSVDASGRLSELASFLEYVQGYLDNEKTFCANLHADLEIDMVPLFAETLPPILHSSLITSTVALLEVELRGYCDAMQQALELSLKMGDLSGGLLDRSWTYLTKVCDLELDSQRLRWPDVAGLFEIRNCLVHSGGGLAEFQKANVIRAFSSRNGSPSLTKERITVDVRTSGICIEIAENFLDEIFDLALKRFPGHYQARRSS